MPRAARAGIKTPDPRSSDHFPSLLLAHSSLLRRMRRAGSLMKLRRISRRTRKSKRHYQYTTFFLTVVLHRVQSLPTVHNVCEVSLAAFNQQVLHEFNKVNSEELVKLTTP